MIITSTILVLFPLALIVPVWLFKWRRDLLPVPAVLSIILVVLSVCGVRNVTSTWAALIQTEWDILDGHAQAIDSGISPTGEYLQDARKVHAKAIEFLLHADKLPLFYRGESVALLKERLRRE